MDNYWYEFWVTYYDDMSESEKADHGIMYGTTMADISERLEDFYGKENVNEVQIKLLATYENTPLFFERDCNPNTERHWKKEEFEQFYD